jgi:Flp pilus assembly protein TadG
MLSARPRPPGFWRDRRGVSAVEFALIAPVLLLLYCGLAELTQAMMAQRRLNQVTAAIGDLVSQTSQVDANRLKDVFLIGQTIMAPFPTTTLRMCVVSVTADTKGKATVDWVALSNAPTNCPKQNDVVTDTPPGVLAASQSVIMARSSYAYDSPIKFVLPGATAMNRTFYLRPRKAGTVLKVN